MRPDGLEIDVETAEQMLAAGDAMLIDVREDHEYRRGRVPGSVHIPLGQLPALMWKLPRDRRLLVICAHGNRSLVAAKYMLNRGFDEAVSVAGGTVAWARSGRTLERG